MSADEYITSVIKKYSITRGPTSNQEKVGAAVFPIIQEWAGKFLNEVSFSGSYAKDTAIRGSTDVDLFISLKSETTETLGEIYDKLDDFLKAKKLSPRRQNVSIGLTHSGMLVDLVPAKRQSGNTNVHSLYRNKAKTWTQTDVNAHIKMISKSGRRDEIRSAKIWRNLNKLDFPSFYLEMAVLYGLYKRPANQPAKNFWSFLEYLRDDFEKAKITDPTNTNNIISEDLTANEKQAIAITARESLRKSNWSQVLW
jgi:hypothetical protein